MSADYGNDRIMVTSQEYIDLNFLYTYNNNSCRMLMSWYFQKKNWNRNMNANL